MVRPIVWGQTRIAGNLIDYQDFKSSTPSSSGGKGGPAGIGGKGNTSTSTTYTATVDVGLCEGPISNVVGVWENKTFGTPAQFGFTIFTGGYAQLPWGYMQTAHPTHALNYRGLAHAAQANMNLGSSPELPQIGWEILSTISYALGKPPDSFRTLYGNDPSGWPKVRQGSTPLTPTSGVPDANPRDVVVDFLTNVNYGVGWPAARLDLVMNEYSSACLALGLLVSPALVEAKDANAFLQEVADATHAGFRWSSGVLSMVPWYDAAIMSGMTSNVTETHAIPVPAPPPTGPAPQPSIQIGIGGFVSDQGVKVTGGGSSFTKIAYSRFGATLATLTYMVSPSGLYTFSTADEGTSVDISYVSAAQASYQPNTTPIYDISDFLPNEGGGGNIGGNHPIVSVRKPTYYQYNSVKLEWLDRNNNYDPSVIEVMDQAAIDAYVKRSRDLKQTHMFCLGASATMSATLQLQREKIPNIYTFTVGPQFILLDVEDIVTLTRSVMGLSKQPVRVTEIQENESGTLTITAEEYMGTVGPPLYATQAPGGTVANYNADPGNVNKPIIFEPTDQLAGGLQIWGAVSGSNPVWGGCNVWASYDNVNYAQVGTVIGAARMGTLTAPLPAVTPAATGQTIDTTSTLAVDLTESFGALISGSAADLAAFNTKCFVDGEIVAYQTATLTATSKYSLTTLNRGGFGSTISAHAAGSNFARLDTGIFTDGYDQSRIGSTIYFKFQSFNQWKGGVQNLANVSAYPYVITGAALASPLPNVANVRSYFEAGFQKIYWDEITDFRNGIVYEVRKGTSFAAGLTVGVLAHPPFVAFGDDTFWISARCQPTPGLTVYSATAQTIAISGSALTPNIIKAWDEKATSWSGYFYGATHPQGSNPNAFLTGAGTYEVPISHWIDVGYVAPLSVSGSYVGTGTPTGQDILTMADVLSVSDLLGGQVTGYIDVHLEIAISQNGISSGYPVTGNLSAQEGIASAWYANESLAPMMVATGGTINSATTTAISGVAGTSHLNVNSTVGMNAGDLILDLTDAGVIPANTFITSISSPVVFISNNLGGGGVTNGATIVTSGAIGARPVIAEARSIQAPTEIARSKRSPGLTQFSSFGQWQKFVPGVYLARTVKMRAVLTTLDATVAVPNLLSFTWQVIVNTRIDHYQAQLTSAVSNTTITFQPDGASATAAFNFGPNGTTTPYVTFSITDAVQGDTVVVNSISLSAITFHVIASGGSQVARHVNVTAEGA